MKLMIPASLAALLLVAGHADAATQNSQQTRMASCNKQAGDKKGDERSTFMQHCLSTHKTGTGTHHTGKKTGAHKTSGKTSHAHSQTHAKAPAAAPASEPAAAPAAAATPTEQ